MSKNMLFLCWFAVLLPLSALAQGERNSSPPPELKRTVDAIAGKWAGPMTARIPGAAPETFHWTMDCKSVSQGAGAACTNEGKASIGLLSESCLLAYDPDGKAVHYMCVTSMGEVHDHRGQWRDGRTLEFEPLRSGMMGKQVIETMKWSFPDPNTLSKTSTVTMPDGSSMSFEFTGKRL